MRAKRVARTLENSVFRFHGCILCTSRNDLTTILQRAKAMSKGMNSKKQTRKEPAKTMLEKRAARKAKKAAKGAMR